jgi:hypothetical protein
LEKKTLRNNPWVDVPCHKDVWNLLKEQRISDTYYRRGDGQATQDLDWVEATHRNWVKDIIDLSDFGYCYFVNGTTDAIHHWKLTDKRPWQKLCYGEYEYPDMIGPWGNVTCDVPGQYMDEETHRAGKIGIIDPNKVLYMSIPSSADGNYFDLPDTQAPVILDCTYISSTDIQRIDVPLNTEQVFFSFSKGFGLVGQRLGLVYTKEPHLTLQTLKRFENWNYSGVKTIDLIMANFTVDEMWNRHKDLQEVICEEYEFEPSDCFFLATTRDSYYKRRRRMKWNDNARICITPFFDEYK